MQSRLGEVPAKDVWEQTQGCVCPVEPRKGSKVTKIALSGLPASLSVTDGGKCQNSLDNQNLSIVKDLENLRRGELQGGMGRQAEDSRPAERGGH